MERKSLLQHASEYASGGGLAADLARLVARPSISQSEGQAEDLIGYLDQDMRPMLEDIGFDCRIFDNPLPGGAPFLVGSRTETQFCRPS